MRPIRSEIRTLLALALPVMASSINWSLLSVIDIAILGKAGTQAVAAFGASRAVTYVAMLILIGALAGVLVEASRAEGARDARATGDGLWRGIGVALLIGTPVAVILWATAAPVLRAIGVAPTLVGDAAQVVRIFALSIPVLTLHLACANWLQGIGRPARVTAINLALLPVNAALVWWFALGGLGLSPGGAAGAMTATVLCYAIGLVALAVSIARLPDARARALRPRVAPGMAALATFGIVPAIASGLELAGFSWLIALSTGLGDVTAHAFQIVFSVHNLTFAVGAGLASAAGVRVGNAVGEGRPREAIVRTGVALVLTAGLMGAMAAGLAIGATAIVAPFPATPAVAALAVAMLGLWAPFIIGDGAQFVLQYALRSLGHQVVAGVNAILAFFVLTGGLGWWLVKAGWGATALVLASGAGMVAATILNGIAFWWVTRRLQS